MENTLDNLFNTKQIFFVIRFYFDPPIFNIDIMVDKILDHILDPPVDGDLELYHLVSVPLIEELELVDEKMLELVFHERGVKNKPNNSLCSYPGSTSTYRKKCPCRV